MRARLDDLSTALDAHDARPSQKGPVEDTSMAGAMSVGFRVLTELVAAVVVGAVIGWQLDTWLHTSPILLILFLTLGTVAGFWNVYRMAAKPTAARKP